MSTPAATVLTSTPTPESNSSASAAVVSTSANAAAAKEVFTETKYAVEEIEGVVALIDTLSQKTSTELQSIVQSGTTVSFSATQKMSAFASSNSRAGAFSSLQNLSQQLRSMGKIEAAKIVYTVSQGLITLRSHIGDIIPKLALGASTSALMNPISGIAIAAGTIATSLYSSLKTEDETLRTLMDAMGRVAMALSKQMTFIDKAVNHQLSQAMQVVQSQHTESMRDRYQKHKRVIDYFIALHSSMATDREANQLSLLEAVRELKKEQQAEQFKIIEGQLTLYAAVQTQHLRLEERLSAERGDDVLEWIREIHSTIEYAEKGASISNDKFQTFLIKLVNLATIRAKTPTLCADSRLHVTDDEVLQAFRVNMGVEKSKIPHPIYAKLNILRRFFIQHYTFYFSATLPNPFIWAEVSKTMANLMLCQVNSGYPRLSDEKKLDLEKAQSVLKEGESILSFIQNGLIYLPSLAADYFKVLKAFKENLIKEMICYEKRRKETLLMERRKFIEQEVRRLALIIQGEISLSDFECYREIERSIRGMNAEETRIEETCTYKYVKPALVKFPGELSAPESPQSLLVLNFNAEKFIEKEIALLKTRLREAAATIVERAKKVSQQIQSVEPEKSLKQGYSLITCSQLIMPDPSGSFTVPLLLMEGMFEIDPSYLKYDYWFPGSIQYNYSVEKRESDYILHIKAIFTNPSVHPNISKPNGQIKQTIGWKTIKLDLAVVNDATLAAWWYGGHYATVTDKIEIHYQLQSVESRGAIRYYTAPSLTSAASAPLSLTARGEDRKQSLDVAVVNSANAAITLDHFAAPSKSSIDSATGMNSSSYVLHPSKRLLCVYSGCFPPKNPYPAVNFVSLQAGTVELKRLDEDLRLANQDMSTFLGKEKSKILEHIASLIKTLSLDNSSLFQSAQAVDAMYHMLDAAFRIFYGDEYSLLNEKFRWMVDELRVRNSLTCLECIQSSIGTARESIHFLRELEKTLQCEKEFVEMLRTMSTNKALAAQHSPIVSGVSNAMQALTQCMEIFEVTPAVLNEEQSLRIRLRQLEAELAKVKDERTRLQVLASSRQLQAPHLQAQGASQLQTAPSQPRPLEPAVTISAAAGSVLGQ